MAAAKDIDEISAPSPRPSTLSYAIDAVYRHLHTPATPSSGDTSTTEQILHVSLASSPASAVTESSLSTKQAHMSALSALLPQIQADINSYLTARIEGEAAVDAGDKGEEELAERRMLDGDEDGEDEDSEEAEEED
ncbi:uncharacterized protein V1518DRAFT_426557 [Limtongia smithiae]|uniref:uncharacterized protein n=1 Tax=Limtongia smithiae TaxID=1125753 RepID=UPI0034CDE0E5